jgi:hypothetical protein
MSTNFASLLPFLAALKRQTGTPQDNDDGNPPADPLGGAGSGPAPSQSNPMGDLAPSMGQAQPDESN